MKQIQQGDVLFQEIKELPQDAQLMQEGGLLILVKGEATGHHHAIKESKSKLYVQERQGFKIMFLEVAMPEVVEHQEHASQILDAGIWMIGQVKEKDWVSQMERKVID